MAKVKSEMERRVAATQATRDHWIGKPFSFAKGMDCGKMLAWHLRKMGKPIPHAKAGSYRTAVAARAALRRLGFESLPDLMDAHFPRIGWASARTGDVVQVGAAEDRVGLGALAIYLGNQNVLAYHEDSEGVTAGILNEAATAWRIIGK